MKETSDRTPGLVWDHTGMLERIGNDKDIAAALVEGFLTSIPAQVEHIDELIRQNDTEALAQAAHGLKGVAAAVGGERLRNTAMDLEDYSKADKANLLPETYRRLKADFLTLYKTLESSEYNQS